jgi:DNA-binding SARP family transcriptional activator
MLYLKTFGGLSVGRSGSTNQLTPRRRLLALLALIAGHDTAGISRDKLLAYLWPESDSERARDSLKQSLSAVRQLLGLPLITCIGGVLRLNHRLIESDAWEFELALGRGDHAEAVRCYRGPYLDRFHVPGLPKFDGWVNRERQRIAGCYISALRVLVGQAEALGDRQAAIIWYQRLTDAEPLSSAAALGLVRALAAAGSVGTAKAHARAYSARLVEVGAPVDDAVVEFARELRDQPTKRTSASTVRRDYSPAAPIIRGRDRRSGSVTITDLPPSPSLPPVPRFWWGVVAMVWVLALLSSAL